MSPSAPIGSVVIPACNEAAVIARTLAALLRDVPAGAFEVVVACNGCTDDTAPIARTAAPEVTVLDLPPIGKARAIRAAEEVTSTLPRLYLDADIELPGPSAAKVLRTLAEGAAGARPPAVHEVAGASWLVRRYYDARAALPLFDTQLFGAGVYGLGEAARARFEEFPDITADDLFAARIVQPHEVVVVDCEPVVVRAPQDARSLLHTLTRVQRGNRELERTMPSLVTSSTRSTVRSLATLGRDPRRWPSIAVFGAFAVVARWRVRRSTGAWERDETSRADSGT